MKIGFTYDLRSIHQPKKNSPIDYYGEYESDETINAIENALQKLGHSVIKIGNIKDLIRFLADGKKVDLVFNMAEGREGRARESQVPNLLEAYNIPYTFSDSFSLALCLDKSLTKQLLCGANIPTPKYLVLPPNTPINIDAADALGYPLFLKPLREGTSKGIDEKAIAHNAEELAERARWLWQTYHQPVLVEEYLLGREFTVGILGTGTRSRVLGVLEIALALESKVYGFVEKEACETMVAYTELDDPALIDTLSQIALDAWNLLECRDGGRVDFMLDKDGLPQVLEINTLPGMHPTHSDLPMIATHCGMSYHDLIGEIIASATLRIK